MKSAISCPLIDILSLAFSTDVSLLASTSGESIIPWDTGNWDQLAFLEGSADQMFFPLDGKFLVSEIYERGGKLWGLQGNSLTAKCAGVKVVVILGQFASSQWKAAISIDWLAPAGKLLHEIQISSGQSIVETCAYNLNGFRRYVQLRQRRSGVQVSERTNGEVLVTQSFEGIPPAECPHQWSFSPAAFTDTIDSDAPDVRSIPALLAWCDVTIELSVTYYAK
jgi:hypothetical protein